VGCLGVLTLFAGLAIGVTMLVFSLIKSSDVYKESVAAATASEQVQEVLGTPVEPAWYLMGNINTSGSSGNADITVPISGPNGKAWVYAVAEKSGGKWTFSMLTVQIAETQARINLLEPEERVPDQP
ncbi:cytochrome c oxidase assembly factor Coa1 family protein, partial [Planctomycetota bacterium]